MTDNNNMVLPVQPLYGNGGGYGGGFGGWGSDIWLILIILFACGGFGGWGGMGGFGGGFGNMFEFPWLLTGQQQISNNTNDGFRDQMIQTGISSVNDRIANLSTQICGGVGDIQNSLCNGFNGVNMTVNNAQNAIAQQLYGNQIASMQTAFAGQTAMNQGFNNVQSQLANCCCENRLGIANLGSDIAREACATRTNDTQNTQSILNVINGGIQSIKDQLCQDKIDAKNDEIANLRQTIAMKDLAASQTAQNAFIAQGFNNEIDALYNRLNSCPVPTTPVYGRTPIFQCNNNGCGCGCGNNF